MTQPKTPLLIKFIVGLVVALTVIGFYLARK